MMLRELTSEEKQAVAAESMDPSCMSVLYANESELHLRNHKSGSDIIIYWGLKHRAEHQNR